MLIYNDRYSSHKDEGDGRQSSDEFTFFAYFATQKALSPEWEAGTVSCWLVPGTEDDVEW